MKFDWHAEKAVNNLSKHGIDFEDAIGIFEGPVLEFRSRRSDEERWIAIGRVAHREITVVYTMRNEIYRIISARRASRNEREAYHAANPE